MVFFLKSLSVIVPAYNEEENVRATVFEAHAVLSPAVAGEMEWVIVDDGSVDGTWDEIMGLSEEMLDVRPLRHVENKGLAAAIWTGVAHATNEWILWMPADGQISAHAVLGMIKAAEQSDLVLLMRQEEQRDFFRRSLTFFMNAFIRWALGVELEGYSGVFLIRNEILKKIPFVSTTALQNYLVASYCGERNLRISYAPVVVQPRRSGSSKVLNVPTMLRTFWDIMKIKLSR
ncbi:MAG: glycosyltransferase family 2 protein [Anaerolineae bacterium]